MGDLNWDGKTKEMFDVLIEGSPKPFQEMTRKNLTASIEKQVGDGGTVTNDVIIAAVKEVTPKPFLAMAMKRLEPFLEG